MMKRFSIISVLFFALFLFVNCSGSSDSSKDVVGTDTTENDVTSTDTSSQTDTIEEYVIETSTEDVKQQEIVAIETANDTTTDTFATCNDLYLKCIASCTDDTCINDCKAKAATDDVKTAYDTMSQCFTDNQCSDKTTVYDNLSCIADNCQDAFSGCLFNEGKCQNINVCAKDCSKDDLLCYYICLSSGTKEAQNAFIKYFTCIEKQCGNEPSENDKLQCQDSANGKECMIQFTQCFGTR